MIHVTLYMLNKYFCWLEGRNKVFRYVNGYIALDVAPDLLLSSFDNETPEATDIDVVTASK